MTLIIACAPAWMTLNAQFHALPVGDGTWVDAFWIGPGYPWQSWIYQISATPDTMIAGTAYRKVIGHVGGAVRDDLLGKVYYVAPDSSTEKLLYDFDVSVGDTLVFDNGFVLQDTILVQGVDTVIINGAPRRRITVTLVDGWGPSQWIQGIGSDGGLFNPCQGPSVSGTSWLVCMTDNGIVQYGPNVGGVGDCAMYMGAQVTDAALSELTIWPNPGSSRFHITIPGSGIGRTVRIRDVRGTFMGEWGMSDAGISVETFDWPAGMFIVEVSGPFGSVHRAKWVRD